MFYQKFIWHHWVKVDRAQFFPGDARWVSGGIMCLFLTFE